MGHRNAPLTPEGRRRLCQRVDAGRPICHVASEAGVARQTLAKWHARWVQDGDDGLHDRSSRPCRSPKQTDPQVEDLVEWLRRGMKLGPVMLVAELAEFGIVLAASTIHRILTDNGSCYRGRAFNQALGATVHKFTKPYRPQTNGKVERYHRTLAREWAYQQAWTSNQHRAEALQAFLDRYNYRRPHTALGGRPPVTRTTVTNLA